METLNLTVNGTPRQYPAPITVTALLKEIGMVEKRVAVEINLEIVPRSQHGAYLLQDRDTVEVVQAIGGG